MTQWHHCFHVCHEAEESDNSNINTESHDVGADVFTSNVSKIVIPIGLHLPAFS